MNRLAVRSAAPVLHPTTLLTYGFVGSLVVAYVAARAILVPFTYDEAATFLRYIDGDMSNVFDFSVATNHFLNTVATRLSYQVFGGAPWALRLPNVLASIGFVVAAAAIARRTHSPVIGFASFVVMVSNPYVLDFLALSRGYGIALAMLTGSVYYLLQWLDLPRDAADSRRLLARALGLSAAAVVATFTVLPAFVATVGLILVRLFWGARHHRRAEKAIPWQSVIGLRAVVGWLLAATAFSLLVFASHPVLSQQLFDPITVRVVGLTDDELGLVRVWRDDATTRQRPLDYQGTGTWRTSDRAEAWGLRVELPVRLDSQTDSLEVAIGNTVYRREANEPGPWLSREAGGQQVLQGTGALKAAAPGTGASDRAINWGGNRRMWQVALSYTTPLVAAFAGCGVVLVGIFTTAVRLGWLRPPEAGLVASATFAVGVFTTAPLYLLRRDDQLYFGGRSGLVPDTFGSLVERTAYGASYAARQTEIVLGALALLTVLVVALILFWRGGRAKLAAPAAILGLVAAAIAQIAVQHAVLGTPWLTGRTALFLVPLMTAFLGLTADALAQAKGARALVTSTMALLAAGSAWHLASVANTTTTLDWPDDVSTPAMMEAVATAVADAAPRTVRVDVDPPFYPTARYYATRLRKTPTDYDVGVASPDRAPDFVYTAQRPDPAAATLIRGFGHSTAALWRLRPDAP